MTFKKVPPREIATIPTCESCKSYVSHLQEGESGAVSGLYESCRIRDIDIWKNRPGCMLHSFFLACLDLEAPDKPHLPMPSEYDLQAKVEYDVGVAIRDAVGAYAMEGGRGLTQGPGLSGILEVLRIVVKEILESLIKEGITPSIESHTEFLIKQVNAYVEQSISTLRKELTRNVQNNGEAPGIGDGGD